MFTENSFQSFKITIDTTPMKYQHYKYDISKISTRHFSKVINDNFKTEYEPSFLE